MKKFIEMAVSLRQTAADRSTYISRAFFRVQQNAGIGCYVFASFFVESRRETCSVDILYTRHTTREMLVVTPKGFQQERSRPRRFVLILLSAICSFLFILWTWEKMTNVDLEGVGIGIRIGGGGEEEEERETRTTRIGSPYELISPLAKRIFAVQSDCTLPKVRFNMDWAGMGADIHVWSHFICNFGLLEGKRLEMKIAQRWRWEDKAYCNSNISPGLACYFPSEELRCLRSTTGTTATPPPLDERATETRKGKETYIRNHRKLTKCPSVVYDKETLRRYRAAATEYLFHRGLRPHVHEEVRRQIRQVFASGGGAGDAIPPNLITVHIRWGNKAMEMELVEIDEYVAAVKKILRRRRQRIGGGIGSKRISPDSSDDVHIYISTNEPTATDLFRKVAPRAWNVYGDAMVGTLSEFLPQTIQRSNDKDFAESTQGRAGTVQLASLLIAMEANDFVLTTGSNWSRLMDELRRNVVDPRCDNCTTLVDLQSKWHG